MKGIDTPRAAPIIRIGSLAEFRVMPATAPEIYDDVLESMPIDPEGILAFKLPRKLQQRLSKLAARNNSGKLTPDEHFELQKFLALEATVRALKAKALLAKSKKA